MRSIKNKLIIAFVVIIGALTVSEVFFFSMNFILIKRYNDFSETMVSEYRLIETSSSLVEAFNSLIKYADDQERVQKFNNIRAELTFLLEQLDNSIIDSQSKVAYIGLKNTINSVIMECNDGVESVMRGDYLSVANHYDEASRKNIFVRENTISLLLKELEYFKKIQNEISHTQKIERVVGLFLFVIINIGCILYAMAFAKRIISPLVKLTKFAEVIRNGGLYSKVDQELLDANDEVGSLANSFNMAMVFLRSNIDKLEDYNKKLLDNKLELDMKNKELGEMNSLMVGRELKMSELKDEIKVLEDKLKAAQG